ncbi:MAG: alpha/beta fold hydrolase, partial [Pseudomonadota bacterium]|nr:alpha/beta fold hydrolase [Pseudomonadota bacterium]
MKDSNSRRQFLQALTIAGPSLAVANRLLAQIPDTINPGITSYPDNWLPVGIRSRFVDNVNGLRVHVLESGYETPDRPVLLLLHGFPELAYSWRKIMVPLADAGYHVLAPDLRGYGRTTGWSSDYDT